MAVETELKLALSPQEASRLWRRLPPDIDASPSTRQDLLSIYYDTPEQELRSQRVALRVRRVGRGWVQTLKGGGGVQGGLHSRFEWESPVSGDQPDLTRIDDPGLAAMFAERGWRDRLHPVFSTRFQRTARLLRLPSGDEIEIALDRGEVVAGELRAPLCELELELKAGRPVALFDIALALLDRGLVVELDDTSKAQRGYGLITPSVPGPIKAASPSLQPSDSAADAFRAIAGACVQQLHANRPGMLQGEDPEYLHQMRVALRRLRSAFSLFGHLLSAERADSLVAEIRWLAASLGAARDWDVLLSEGLPALRKQLPANDALDALARVAEGVRDARGQQAREAVRATRYTRLLLKLGAELQRGEWQDEQAAVQSVAALAPVLLRRLHRRLVKRGADLPRRPPAERHQARIAAKKLRYAADFFSSLYPRKRTTRYLQGLAALQDVLGHLNDASVGGNLLGSLAEPEAHGILLGWNACRTAHELENLDGVWQGWRDCEPFWKTN